MFLSEFSTLEVSATHRKLSTHYVETLRNNWQTESNVRASSKRYMKDYQENQSSPTADDEQTPNSLAKIVCVVKPNATKSNSVDLSLASEYTKQLDIVGFHFVGKNAGEIIQGFALALRCGCTKYDLDMTDNNNPYEN